MYLDAMKGVMSNSRGKETYVVIFRRSFAECSNLWGERPERDDKRGGKWEKWRVVGGGVVFGNNRYYRFIPENTAREE